MRSVSSKRIFDLHIEGVIRILFCILSFLACSLNPTQMILLEIIRAKAIFLLLLFITVIVPVWAVLTYYRRKKNDDTAETED